MNKNIFKRKYSKKFEKDFKKIDSKLQERLEKKIYEIGDNPYQYKSLRNIFKGMQRIHIGSYVLIFEIKEVEKIILFHRFQHHDKAYKTKI